MRTFLIHKQKPFKTMKNWELSDISNAQHRGILELENGEYFEILETRDRLVFGNACNAGFLESGYMMREDHESLDVSLQELHADLETFCSDGAQYVSRIVCNERM